ncbi:MAG: ribonuclease P protein component [Bacteroidetes bacterium]|nr:ribonuclease P protein component [Bacteroidota bacterium]
MQTFTKAERLCSKILIDELIEKGNSFQNFPFKIIWLEVKDDNSMAQIVISVPKRIFKKAVDRNKLKRRTREAYRKNKTILYDHLNNKKILLMFVYTAKTMLVYKEIEEKLIAGLEQLKKKIKNEN